MVMIGVDGGASGFRAHEIVVRDTPGGPRFALGAHSAADEIEPVAGFTPKSLEVQHAEARAASFEISPEEEVLQGRWVHAASHAIWRVAAAAGPAAVCVGVCAPGLKTEDGRGLKLSLNGPRIPDFVDALEQSLMLDGLNLVRPIARVVSDGLACGHGESIAEGGQLADVEHGYYMGGGSGVAEAFKLSGKVLGVDELGGQLEKAWRLRADDGESYESHLSVSGINRAFGIGCNAEVASAELPENAAAAGDPRALALFRARAQRLAELAFARLISIHDARGLILERVVVGQRLGQFFLDARLESCFALHARAELVALLQSRAPVKLREAWLADGALRCGRLLGSALRAAPALGALALALEDV